MAILQYLLETLHDESYYRITISPHPTETNNLYDELEDEDIPTDEIFGTTKDSLLSWLKLFKEEHPDIEKVYVWEFNLPHIPDIESFTYKDNDYKEFTFDPTDVEFELYKGISF